MCPGTVVLPDSFAMAESVSIHAAVPIESLKDPSDTARQVTRVIAHAIFFLLLEEQSSWNAHVASSCKVMKELKSGFLIDHLLCISSAKESSMLQMGLNNCQFGIL